MIYNQNKEATSWSLCFSNSVTLNMDKALKPELMCTAEEGLWSCRKFQRYCFRYIASEKHHQLAGESRPPIPPPPTGQKNYPTLRHPSILPAEIKLSNIGWKRIWVAILCFYNNNNNHVSTFYFCFLRLHCPHGISSLEYLVAFSRESHLQKLHYPTYDAYWVF